MSEWDFGGSGNFENPGQPSGGSGQNTGGLNTAMCIACLMAVSAVSFLVSWLMKDIVRSFWQMGLTFAAPFATLMLSSLLVERNTHLMTPSSSIGPQRLFALATIIVAFAVGCVTVLTHDPVEIQHEQIISEPGEYDYVFLLDKSGSMDGSRETACKKAANDVIAKLSDSTRVGVVAFDNHIRDYADILPLTAEHRTKVTSVINIYPNGLTNFDLALDKAMELIDDMTDRPRTIRVILVSDGADTEGSTCKRFTNWAEALNAQNTSFKQVELCGIQIESSMPSIVRNAVNATGGTIIDQAAASDLASSFETVVIKSVEKVNLYSEDVDILKATYNGDADSNTGYKILSAILLVALGVLAGISLMVMFSSRKQFRAQVITSALAGVCAFLLLNYGKSIGIAPAWICEAVAFTLFGLVFMNKNLGVNRSGRITQQAEPDPFPSTGGFDDF